jgi:hypothetical protein
MRKMRNVKWITKKDMTGENKHIPILLTRSSIPERELRDINLSTQMLKEAKREREKVRNLEKKARDMLKDISNISDVDILLDNLKRYTGLLSDYSPFNASLIQEYDPDYTIVRSKQEWDRFGYELKDDAKKIPILVPIGVPKKHMPGEIVKFIEEKRAEGLSDEMIEHLVLEKFGKNVGGYTHTFKVGYVYDKRDVKPNPKKKQLQEWNIDLTSEELYEKAKKFAEQNNIKVVEGDTGSARGWSAGPEIHVMKVPGEDREAVNTMLHEIAHSLLEHYKTWHLTRDQKEAEAELTAYLVAGHYGVDLHKEAKAYIGAWLDKKGDKFTEENLDRVLKISKEIINGIDKMNYIKVNKK